MEAAALPQPAALPPRAAFGSRGQPREAGRFRLTREASLRHRRAAEAELICLTQRYRGNNHYDWESGGCGEREGTQNKPLSFQLENFVGAHAWQAQRNSHHNHSSFRGRDRADHSVSQTSYFLSDWQGQKLLGRYWLELAAHLKSVSAHTYFLLKGTCSDRDRAAILISGNFNWAMRGKEEELAREIQFSTDLNLCIPLFSVKSSIK